jgi:predicted DNA-binding transcriptional regulator AlpA
MSSLAGYIDFRLTSPKQKLIAPLSVSLRFGTRCRGRKRMRSRDQQPLEPRGLSRTEAAAYVGVSPSLFDEMVKDGRMPEPKRINSRVVWDRRRLDDAFEALPDMTEANPWDEAAA